MSGSVEMNQETWVFFSFPVAQPFQWSKAVFVSAVALTGGSGKSAEREVSVGAPLHDRELPASRVP